MQKWKYIMLGTWLIKYPVYILPSRQISILFLFCIILGVIVYPDNIHVSQEVAVLLAVNACMWKGGVIIAGYSG